MSRTVELIITEKEELPLYHIITKPQREEKKILMDSKPQQQKINYLDARIDQIRDELLKGNKDLIDDLLQRLVKLEGQFEALKRSHNDLVEKVVAIANGLETDLTDVKRRLDDLEDDRYSYDGI